jgi:hypothetical protein
VCSSSLYCLSCACSSSFYTAEPLHALRVYILPELSYRMLSGFAYPALRIREVLSCYALRVYIASAVARSYTAEPLHTLRVIYCRSWAVARYLGLHTLFCAFERFELLHTLRVLHCWAAAHSSSCILPELSCRTISRFAYPALRIREVLSCRILLEFYITEPLRALRVVILPELSCRTLSGFAYPALRIREVLSCRILFEFYTAEPLHTLWIIILPKLSYYMLSRFVFEKKL